MTLLTAFKSAVTRKLLGHFFAHPQDRLYVNEIAKILSLDKRNLVKKLREFETAGLLKKEARGNMRLYSINADFPLYNEYRRIVLAAAAPTTVIPAKAWNQ